MARAHPAATPGVSWSGEAIARVAEAPAGRHAATAMIEIRRILCPVDFSEYSARALEHAAAFARWHEAEVVALHVLAPLLVPGGLPGYPTPLTIDPGLRRWAEAEMSALTGRLAGQARLRPVLREGAVVREILQEAAALPSDLLVLGTHGHGGFEEWVLGSVAEKVLRKAPCPVLTFTKPGSLDPPKPLFKSLLCAVDFSEASVRGLEWALSLAQEADARITLLHVVEGFSPDPPAVFDFTETRRQLEEEARARLRRMLPEGASVWCDPDQEVRFGRPGEEILRVAQDRGSEVIVMGARGRGPLARLFLGSTVHHVVRASDRPVLTIRTPQG